MTDTETLMSNIERDRMARAKLSEAHKGAVFDVLAAAKIDRVLVEFDGEGDSGQITGVAAFRKKKAVVLPATTVPMQQIKWVCSEPATAEVALQEAIETLCYDYLEDTHGGWENNDGGFGEFRLDVAARTVELEFNGRYTDTFTSNHTF